MAVFGAVLLGALVLGVLLFATQRAAVPLAAANATSPAVSAAAHLEERIGALERAQTETLRLLNRLAAPRHAARAVDGLFDVQAQLRLATALVGELRALRAATVADGRDANAASGAPRDNIYLSVVVTGRNDDHHQGAETQTVTQHFLDALGAEAAAAEVWVELVFVEWNPPPDRRSVLEQYRWPRRFVELQILSVPRALHERALEAEQRAAEKRTLAWWRASDWLQWEAKSVGIRRASGEFVLATNTDMLVAAGFLQWLRTKPLQRNTLYSANTPHYNPSGLVEGRNLMLSKTATVAQIRQRCRVDATNVRMTEAEFKSTPNRVFPSDFQLAHRDVWRRLRGYSALEPRPAVALQITAAHIGVAGSFIPDFVLCHQHHTNEDLDEWKHEHDVEQETDGARIRQSGSNWGLADADEDIEVMRLPGTQ